jgi:hypothetical protein
MFWRGEGWLVRGPVGGNGQLGENQKERAELEDGRQQV